MTPGSHVDDHTATTPCRDLGERGGLAGRSKGSCADTAGRRVEVSITMWGRLKLTSSRVSDDDKLAIYVKIVRLMLEVRCLARVPNVFFLLNHAVRGERSGSDVSIESVTD